MMLKCFVALLVLATGFCARPPQTAPAGPSPRPSPQIDVEAERYAVYSALLNQRTSGDKPPAQLVIVSETKKDSTLEDEWSRFEIEPAWKAAVDDYRTKNLRPAVIENKFDVPIKVALISKEAVDKLFCEGCGWWKEFYKQYPKSTGLITFSNVGFNPEMTYALAEVGYSCGGLCGNGGLVLMVKKDGKWKIERQLTAWVS